MDTQPDTNDIDDIETKVICPTCGNWYRERSPEMRDGICRKCREMFSGPDK